MGPYLSLPPADPHLEASRAFGPQWGEEERAVALAVLSAPANLKLMKCGGLRQTQRMIHAARAHRLEVMLGCMIESNASIAAAAHLAPLLDYADLDGSLLLAEDPYAGAPLPSGRVELESMTRAGTGARQR